MAYSQQDFENRLPTIARQKHELDYDRASRPFVTFKHIPCRLSMMGELDKSIRNFLNDIEDYKATLDPYVADHLKAKIRPLWNGVDESNTSDLKGIIFDHGWITPSKFGKDLAEYAWLIVQHADHDPDFQKEILAEMTARLHEGDCPLKDYAYLYDRVYAAPGHPERRQLQRYGTQIQKDNKTPYPMEDPENVNARRATVGLGTIEEYLKRFNPQSGAKNPPTP